MIISGIALLSLVICFAVLREKNPAMASWKDRPTPQRTVFIYREEFDDGRDIPPPCKVPGMKPSRFLYLVQTESCLPSNLKSSETIGDPEICNCDVLVLSYSEVCREQPLDHVEYIFKSQTTWSMGRNHLFRAAMSRKEKYWYYIFIDDDVILESLENDHQPWRKYENFLRHVEPAVGGLDCTCYPFLEYAHIARSMQGCGPMPSLYYSSPRFDAAFNGFHYQAVEYILPYLEKYDYHSWSLAALYASIKIEIFFAGHAVLPTRLYVTSLKHRPYPRNAFTNSLLISILDIVEYELPTKYRNSSVLAAWRKSKFSHEHNSRTFCVSPAPPHTPIKPFAYAKQVELAKESIKNE